MYSIIDVNDEIYAEGETIEDLIYTWNGSLEYAFEWLICGDVDDDEDLYYECIQKAENLDDIKRIISKINYYFPDNAMEIIFE